jgi:hypothetical protein
MSPLATEWQEAPEAADVIPPTSGSDSVAKWFAQKFPKLGAEFGDAVLEEPDKHGKQIVSVFASRS